MDRNDNMSIFTVLSFCCSWVAKTQALASLNYNNCNKSLQINRNPGSAHKSTIFYIYRLVVVFRLRFNPSNKQPHAHNWIFDLGLTSIRSTSILLTLNWSKTLRFGNKVLLRWRNRIICNAGCYCYNKLLSRWLFLYSSNSVHNDLYKNLFYVLKSEVETCCRERG